jgi:SAM-dependent methyltransferase
MVEQVPCPLCLGVPTRHYADHSVYPQRLRICKRCNLFFVHPHVSEIPSVTYERQNQANFRFWGSKKAERAYKLWRETVNAKALMRLQAHHCVGRTLEIGFGEGPLTEKLLTFVSEYWGIEPIPASYRRTLSRLAMNPDKVKCMRAENLDHEQPFAGMDHYFDCLILVSVFEHLPNPRHMLESCARLLKPGGKLYLSTPDSRRFVWIRKARLFLGMEPWSHFHISFFREENLEQTFRQTGFVIRSKEHDRLIDPLSALYFRELTGSLGVWLAMKTASLTGLDRLMRIQTLFYVLEKNESI